MNVRTFRSFLPAFALAALLGLAGASSSVEHVSHPGGSLTAGTVTLPMVAEVSAPGPAVVVVVLSDSGPSPRVAGRAAGPLPAGPVRSSRHVSLPPVEERLAPAMGREGHPSTAPPRSS